MKKHVIDLTPDVVTAVCPKCGKAYELGYSGTVEGCDSCINARRDGSNYDWLPGTNPTQADLEKAGGKRK